MSRCGASSGGLAGDGFAGNSRLAGCFTICRLYGDIAGAEGCRSAPRGNCRSGRGKGPMDRTEILAADALCQLLRGYSFHFSTEKQFQDGIEEVLQLRGLPYRREVAISPRSIIDFMVGTVGIEVKVGGGISEITRQLHRYAQSDAITELILVTSRMRHTLKLPASLNSKPIHV